MSIVVRAPTVLPASELELRSRRRHVLTDRTLCRGSLEDYLLKQGLEDDEQLFAGAYLCCRLGPGTWRTFCGGIA